MDHDAVTSFSLMFVPLTRMRSCVMDRHNASVESGDLANVALYPRTTLSCLVRESGR